MATLRIMIVEDDALLAAILAELLAEMGHAVCATETTEAGAIAAAARALPDLILMDVALAQGDGRAAMAAIEAQGRVAHVFITGAGPLFEGLAPGAVTLRKPFSERLLAQAIARARSAVSRAGRARPEAREPDPEGR